MTTNATNAATRVNDNGARDINIDDRIDIELHVGGEGGRKMDDEDNNSDDCGEGYCITLYRTTTMMTNAAKALGLSRATMTVASVLLLLLFSSSSSFAIFPVAATATAPLPSGHSPPVVIVIIVHGSRPNAPPPSSPLSQYSPPPPLTRLMIRMNWEGTCFGKSSLR